MFKCVSDLLRLVDDTKMVKSCFDDSSSPSSRPSALRGELFRGAHEKRKAMFAVISEKGSISEDNNDNNRGRFLLGNSCKGFHSPSPPAHDFCF